MPLLLFILVVLIGVPMSGPSVEAEGTQAESEEEFWLRASDFKFPLLPRGTNEIERLERADIFVGAAADLEKFRSTFPDSKHAGDALTLQIDWLHSAFLLGRTNLLGVLDELTTQFVQSPESRFLETMYQLKKLDRLAWIDAGQDKGRHWPERKRRYLEYLPTRNAKEQAAIALSLLHEAERHENHVGRIRWAKQIRTASTSKPARNHMAAALRKLGQVGKPARIKFKSTDGRVVDTAKLKGKVVLVQFWSTSCPACLSELPHLKRTYANFQDKGLEIIGINLDEDPGQLAEFLKEQGISWPQHCDERGWANGLAKKFGVDFVPTILVLDRKGVLVGSGSIGDRVSAEYLLAHF